MTDLKTRKEAWLRAEEVLWGPPQKPFDFPKAAPGMQRIIHLIRSLNEEREAFQTAAREGWALPLVEYAQSKFEATNAAWAEILGEETKRKE